MTKNRELERRQGDGLGDWGPGAGAVSGDALREVGASGVGGGVAGTSEAGGDCVPGDGGVICCKQATSWAK